MEALVDVLAIGALALGLTLATIGLFGMLRKHEILHQLHAAALVTGPALVLVLFASVGTGNGGIIAAAALIALFALITSPLSSHAIALAAQHHPEAAEDPDG